MSIKDYAIGKVNKWLGSQGYTVAKKTPRKRTTTRTATKTTTKKKTTRTVARKPATRSRLTYDYRRRGDRLDDLIRQGKNALKLTYDLRNAPKYMRDGAINDYAKKVVAITNYLKKHGSTKTYDELDTFVDDTLTSGRQIKTRLKTAIPTRKIKANKLKQKTVTNSRLTRMAKCR